MNLMLESMKVHLKAMENKRDIYNVIAKIYPPWENPEEMHVDYQKRAIIMGKGDSDE